MDIVLGMISAFAERKRRFDALSPEEQKEVLEKHRIKKEARLVSRQKEARKKNGPFGPPLPPTRQQLRYAKRQEAKLNRSKVK